MRFLLVGNGAREHAIAEAICRNNSVSLFAFMNAKNPGIAKLCEKTGGKFEIGNICDGAAIVNFAVANSISLSFSSPDATLQAGVSDALIAKGIPCASPTKSASRVEWDKSFARNLMKKYAIGGSPKFGVFKGADEAAKFIDSLKGEAAVKPSGLTGGKGVKVVGVQLKDAEEAKEYAREILQSNMGGLKELVIEEKLIGEEFTLQAFCDGKTLIPMLLVQDHKLAFENETGPNTGGMGSYSDANHLLPFISQEEYDFAVSIMQQTILALSSESSSFTGVLYGQFIATKEGIKVIEFNARFGDPEAMNALALLEADLYSVMESMAKGTLADTPISFAKKATVCKYLVPKSYPGKSEENEEIKINGEALAKSNAKIYYSSVYEKEGKIYTQKSRSIGVLGIAGSISEAERISEDGCTSISGVLRHRRDIGTKALINRKIERMNKIRS
ncbi:phosphoribosylamine--glycine ligase [Candidatus Micrarchaeota archaeon CG1_02_47_40]|nr:MAG: phosphoribosylamine--glycine ligase [Candidatus Micrarchaeota archaeon CG1_02_47_40]